MSPNVSVYETCQIIIDTVCEWFSIYHRTLTSLRPTWSHHPSLWLQLTCSPLIALFPWHWKSFKLCCLSFLHSKGLLNFFKFFIWNHQQHLRTEIKHKNIFQGKIYTKHGPWLNGNWQEYFCQIWWILDSVPHTHKYCHIWVYLKDQPSLFQKKCCYSLACLCTFLSGSA